ncbi:hypothetical protein CDL15_Pgr020389 [Punica granatum]|uniref:CRM domain-containing protein n=1 Tax=Punica granatum TaxID=22663 RepID=A0A218VX17_PUNGR|nr:hypothetical protein CDL15_Pgr020389 [Punica granatum]
MMATLFLSPSPAPKPSNTLYRNAPSPAPPLSVSSSSSSKPPTRVPAQRFPSKIQEIPPSPELNSRSNAFVKMPTAPWMKGPLLLPSHEVLDPKKTQVGKSSGSGKVEKADRALTDKVGGVRGSKTVQKIVRSIERLQRTRQSAGCHSDSEDIDLGLRIPYKEVEGDGKSDSGGKLPWVQDERILFRRVKKEKVVTAAELTLEKELLARLRGEAKKMRKWVKVMKIGVSEEVVHEINRIWRRNELVMVKFDIPLSRNMDRAQEIVEEKTGGLVVWRRKDTLFIYRGVDYHSKRSSERDGGLYNGQISDTQQMSSGSADIRPVEYNGRAMDKEFKGVTGQWEDFIFMSAGKSPASVDKSLYERETDRLLDSLGPRFEDWWMRKPLPVDADVLPEVVPGFRPPLRMCPPNERSQLTDDELTYLRKIAHPLPTHFVLGRNRRLQGLAAAIIYLWEKSLIAKIAVKWGVPNTDNEEMANELKHLTGGVLLLRNKFYIILFRGKDFLPSGVATSVAERELKLKRCQLQEEDARCKASESIPLADDPLPTSSTTGTLSDFNKIHTEHRDLGVGNKGANLQVEAEIERLRKELRKQGRRLFILKSKSNISEKRLLKLNSGWKPAEWDPDQGMMTEEERECLRKIGLKMDDYLALGRRGVFDGAIEALHQHWKHREVVKVITMQRMYAQIIETANLLEAESGGILVSVDEQKEGHAIIIYRGKNYRRPLKLPAKHLLTKRRALLRSLEMQRLGSLKFFARRKERAISDLKLKLAQLESQLLKDHEIQKP